MQIENLNFSYLGNPIFENVNMYITPGKFTCLLGPSGVGKTTLLRLFAGLEKTENYFNIDEIAYMSQTDLLLPWLSAWDNALIGTKLRGNYSAELIVQAMELFAETGLSNDKNKFPNQLSGGMRQRVSLIRTLLENKPIILMDEPFSAIDAITRFQLQNLAAKLLKNRTVLFITHDPFEALRLGTDIYIMLGKPAYVEKILELQSSIPRDIDSPEIKEHQAKLFHALTRAKETV